MQVVNEAMRQLAFRTGDDFNKFRTKNKCTVYLDAIGVLESCNHIRSKQPNLLEARKRAFWRL